MWNCDCDKNGIQSERYSLAPTHTDELDCCTRCGNYAVWVRPEQRIADDGSCIHRSVTVFNLKDDTFKHFNDLREASKWAGYKSNESLSRNLGSKEMYFYSNPKRIAVCVGHFTKMPYELKQLVETHLLYAYCYDTGKLLAKGTYDELAKELDIPKPSIFAAFKRGYINKKRNCVFSPRKEFDINVYKSTQKKGFASHKINPTTTPILHEEFTGYNEGELGVKTVKDTYGTWQDLLYS